MNDIIILLDLEDSNLNITDVTITGNKKYVTLETDPTIHFCPVCNFRMHSRGTKTRTINHPILQDTYQLIIKLKQRRWRCTNPICKYESSETFNFVNKYRRNSNATDILIVNSFRDLSNTAVKIAETFKTSDTHVLDVFDNYVKMERLPLTDAICIDEVYLNMDYNCKYVLVIQDFHTGQTIDMLHSRRNNVTEPYFAAIPKEERFAVKYLISDMYNPYLAYTSKYFPNAISVVDSFHVVQWLNRSLENFIRTLLREFRRRDEEIRQARELELGRPVPHHISNEVYILSKYSFFLLKNLDHIEYHSDTRIDKHFRYYMNSYDYERMFFDIHPNLKTFRDLKELYIRFNARNAGNPTQAAIELDELIKTYAYSEYDIFKEFALLLYKHKEPIINSFIMTERVGNGNVYESRLSNGPIEALNRKAKDLKRSGRGYRNFQHLRNRFLFATRIDPSLDGKEPIKWTEEI